MQSNYTNLWLIECVLNKNVAVYLQANKWCTRGVELLASQHIEKCALSQEYAEQSLQNVQHFILSANEFCVSSPREFRNVFQDSTTLETKALVSQVNTYWVI